MLAVLEIGGCSSSEVGWNDELELWTTSDDVWKIIYLQYAIYVEFFSPGADNIIIKTPKLRWAGSTQYPTLEKLSIADFELSNINSEWTGICT